MAKRTDKYSQIGYISLVESAANTLTFAGLSVFSNVLQPQGLLIHKIEYNVSHNSLNLLLAADDYIQFGLGGDDSQTAIALENASTYDYNLYGYKINGTPANGELFLMPVVRDFSQLPGGGKLVPADRIYGYIKGNSVASACVATIRFAYTIIDMSAQEYLELAQALRVLQ